MKFTRKKLIVLILTAIFVMAGVLGVINSGYAADLSLFHTRWPSPSGHEILGDEGETFAPLLDDSGKETGFFQDVGDKTYWRLNSDGNLEQVDANGNPMSTDGSPTVKDTASPDANKNRGGEPDAFEIIGNIVAWLLYYIVAAFNWIIVKEVDVLLMIMSYPINLSITAVSNGWAIVRDVCNNFFIVILLAIAVGTILRVPSYKYKEALPKLLIAAVLVNFSKMICGIFIDVSQILMLSFAAPLVTIEGNNIILSALGLPDIAKFLPAKVFEDKTELGILNIIAVLIWGIIISVVAFIVIACIVIVLVYRIVILLFLAILSPLPFFANSFEKLKKYGGEWWDNFTKYLIVGPAMLFFLWLAFSIMGYSSSTASSTTAGQNSLTNITGDAKYQTAAAARTETTSGGFKGTAQEVQQAQILSKAMSTEGMINYVLVIMLLVMSLVMGQKFGGAGAGAAKAGLGFLDKQRKKVTSLPGMAAGFGIKQAKQAGLAVGKGVLGTGLAVTRGLDATLLGGRGAKTIGAMRSKGGVATGVAAGTALGTIGGPLGMAIGAGAGAVLGGLLGKKVSTNMTNWRRQKDSLLEAQGKGDKGKFLDEHGKEVNIFDNKGSVIAGELAKVKYQWRDTKGAYNEVRAGAFDTTKKSFGVFASGDSYKDDDGAAVHRWGEYKDSKGNSYRRFSADDKQYYRVNSAGDFINKAGTVTTTKNELQAASSELVGWLRNVRQMNEGQATYYANYAASKSKGWAAVDAAIDKKVSDAQSAYNRMSTEMLNKLIETESDSTKKMAMALTLATKSGFKDFEKVLAAKQTFGGNSLLSKKFNDEMNQRNMIMNNTLAGGRLDEAAIAKLISSGKADWHKQDTKQLNKAAIDLMAKQLGSEFDSTLEKMMKTDKDRKQVVSAMEQGLDSRTFTDERDLNVRKAYAKASGNWQKGFTDSSSTVNMTEMTKAISSVKSPGVFDDVSKADMGSADFQNAFISGMSVKMLGQMMRSDKISSTKFREYLGIIKRGTGPDATKLQGDITSSTNHDLITEYTRA